LEIFYSPTFAVGREFFWGNDRLEDAMNWPRRPSSAPIDFAELDALNCVAIQSSSAGNLAEWPTHCSDLHRQAALLDRQAGPRRVNQRPTRPLNQLSSSQAVPAASRS